MRPPGRPASIRRWPPTPIAVVATGYCYVPGVLRMSRTEFDTGAIARPSFLHLLEKDAVKYHTLGITEQVMLSFTTDPHPSR